MNDRANLLISVATKTEPKRRTRLAALFHQTKHPDTDVPRSIEDYVQQTGVEWGRRWTGGLITADRRCPDSGVCAD